MNAWLLHGLNHLQLEQAAKPLAKNGEVLVQVRAAGICSSDIQRVFVNGAYHYPIILGHEFAGITDDGQRVGVFPLLPCYQCQSCQIGHYETCDNYSYIGSRQDGAFAEYVAVPKSNLIELPDTMTFEQAALLEPAAVALHAVRLLDLNRAKSLAVVGTGAIGQLIAKWLGILGAERVFLLGRNDKTPAADAYIEAVGSTESFSCCIDNAMPNGQVILVGNPVVDFKIGQNLYWQILRKQLTLKGSWNSSWRSDWQTVLDYAEKLHLDDFISHRFEFSELDKAMDMMHGRHEKYCKVLVTFPDRP